MFRYPHRVAPFLVLLPLALGGLTSAPAFAAPAPSTFHALRAAQSSLPVHPDGENVLYTFQGGSDGALPYAGLVADSSGVLYGTSLHGGSPSGGLGTVYKLTPTGSGYLESVIWTFSGYPSDGQYPYGGLVVDKHGALYGTTYQGGSTGSGMVFKLTPSGSSYSESVLYNFQGGNLDGSGPYAGLYMDARGALFGTTVHGGGPSGGYGTVFKLTPTGSGYLESVIYAFQGYDDGANPWAGLTGDAQGALYGTTSGGGSVQSYGSVFKLTPGSGSSYNKNILFNFPYPGGNHPFGGLVLDAGGALYGTATQGGTYNAGMVFKLTPGGPSYTEQTLYTFDGCEFSSPKCDGAQPEANVYLDPNCTVYGTTQYGGPAGVGTVFKLTPSVKLANRGCTGASNVYAHGYSYTESVLYAFQGGSDGKNPNSTLIEYAGLLYGTSFFGGSYNDGTVFTLNL